MALDTITTMSNDVKQFYDLNLLDNAFPNLVHRNEVWPMRVTA